MRNSYIEALYDIAQENEKVIALVADNGTIVYDKFREDFSERFINFGISEANMVASAAGMASCGLIPFAYTISNFLTMRAFEMIRNDVCLQEQNVKLVGIGAGFIYSDLGPTHHATEDIALMRVLPKMTILSPASPMETKKATRAALKIKGPVYLRIGRNKAEEIYNTDYEFEVGKGITLRAGTDITIIGTGSILNDILKVEEELGEEGISIRVINMHTLKPIDNDIIIKAIEETKAIVTVEEHSIIGGLGSAIAEIIAETKSAIAFERMGLIDSFTKGYGTHDYMKMNNGISKEHIKAKVIEILEEK